MAEMRSSRGTADGAAGISGGNLQVLNTVTPDTSDLELKDWSSAQVAGNCHVSLTDNAKVKARGKATVEARGHSQVIATDDVIVYASDHARVNALGRTVVYARGNSQIDAYEGSTIYAQGNCRVKVVSWGAVTVHLSENAVIDDLVGDAKILTANLEGN